MIKRKYIIIAVTVAVALLISGILLWYFTLDRKDDTDSSKEEPVTLDWYINYNWFKDGWGKNVVSKQITKDTGVSIQFRTPVVENANTLDTMISSDSLPDLITLGYWEPELSQMISSGQVYALNELADKYDKSFYDVSDKASVDWYTQDDGNIYAYPNSSYTPEDAKDKHIPSNQVFIVRKDIYEAIGSPDMTTREGFKAAVEKAAKMFPEVDGQKLIPVGAAPFDDNGCVSFDKYLQNYLGIPYEKNGKYYDRCTDPEYLSWLETFRELNQEGLLSPDIFVDGRTQISEKIADGRYFCMFYQYTDMRDQELAICKNDPKRAYIAVDGPRNSNGNKPVLPIGQIQGWTVTLISKNCKDPEKAIKFLDYLMSEKGQKTVYLGVEGETYEYDDKGDPRFLPEVNKLMETDRKAFNDRYGADDTYWMLQDNVMQYQWAQPDPKPMEDMKAYTYPYAAYTGQYEVSIPEGTDVRRKFDVIQAMWKDTLKKLLIAPTKKEFDSIVSDYNARRDAAGYSDVIKEETRQMNKNKERLGMTGSR